jgi:hypothetical protein
MIADINAEIAAYSVPSVTAGVFSGLDLWHPFLDYVKSGLAFVLSACRGGGLDERGADGDARCGRVCA